MSRNVRYLLLVFFNCLCIVFFLIFNIDMLFGIAMLLWIDLIVYAVSKFNERSVFFGFLVTFFIFLMGRQMLEIFGLHKIETDFPDSVQKKTEITLLLSLMGLFGGYIISGYIKNSKMKIRIKKKQNNEQTLLVPYIRKVSSILFRITYIFAILKVLESAIYVSYAGYLSMYTSFSSNLPYIIQKLAELSPILMFTYLGTLPSKKECQCNIVLYIIYLLSTLATGRRFECIGGLLLLVVYYALRKGYLFSILLGYCVNILIVFFGAGLHKYIDFRHRDKKLEKEMFMFSAPLIASSLSWWINNASDKYILTYMCGLSVVGIYSVAYKIPTILSVLGTVISKAFTISAIKEIDTDDTDGFLGKSYSLISYVMTVGCAVLILLNPFLSKLLFAKDFYIAWKFVPPLLIAFLMSAISGTCQSILTAINKTTIISFTAILGAFVNVILNIILIPLYEGYGAAVATMFSFFVCWIGRYLELKKYVKFKNKISKEIIAYSLVSIEMILAYEENKYIWMESLIVVLIIVLYHKEEIYFIKNIFTKKKYVMEKKK